jgi:hypothetical protein
VEAAKFFESLATLAFHKFSPQAFLEGGNRGNNHETKWKTHFVIVWQRIYLQSYGCNGITRRPHPKGNPQGAAQYEYRPELLGEAHGVDPDPGSV